MELRRGAGMWDVTRACKQHAANILVDDLQRSDSRFLGIAIVETRQLLTSRPIPYTNVIQVSIHNASLRLVVPT